MWITKSFSSSKISQFDPTSFGFLLRKRACSIWLPLSTFFVTATDSRLNIFTYFFTPLLWSDDSIAPRPHLSHWLARKVPSIFLPSSHLYFLSNSASISEHLLAPPPRLSLWTTRKVPSVFLPSKRLYLSPSSVSRIGAFTRAAPQLLYLTNPESSIRFHPVLPPQAICHPALFPPTLPFWRTLLHRHLHTQQPLFQCLLYLKLPHQQPPDTAFALRSF